MEFPDNLLYTKDHEWVKVEGDTITVGITDYAQGQLGDIVFVELPDEGNEYGKGDAFSVVESVKTVSDVYTPVSGKVVSSNEDLESTPETINSDPYGAGWIIKLAVADKAELDELLSPEDYESLVSEESH